MSNTNGQPRGRASLYSKSAEAKPGDEIVGGWRREDLIRMDQRFCVAMERAIARGLERPQHGEAPERAA